MSRNVLKSSIHSASINIVFQVSEDDVEEENQNECLSALIEVLKN